jgi:AcrR family transcriptional regulator
MQHTPSFPALANTKLSVKTVEILDRVKSVFAEKGFDGASMQDLARAADMSAGNFYRYFPSKYAIIEAMVARDLEEVEASFAEIMQSPSPRAALLEGLRQHVIEVQENKDGPLWAEIEAAAGRWPEICKISDRMAEGVRSHLVRVFARIAGIGENEAAARFMSHAEMIIVLVKGAAMTACGGLHIIANPVNREAFNDLVVDLADKLIDRIVAEAAIPHEKA